MQNNIRELIVKSTREIIEKCANDKKLKNIIKKHQAKVHFIPKKYRILGGILQSMNIQFGNFIEVLMKNLIANENHYKILEKYSGRKSNKFSLPLTSDNLIDNYITQCQTQNNDVEIAFRDLCLKIYENNSKNEKSVLFKHDIDLLFKDTRNSNIYYLEIKYNDDHDTGKFVDINRKFIKTYAYLLNEFKLNSFDKIKPILFFFNNKKMKGNIYIPESSHIYRGERFFKEFLSTNYKDLENYLQNFSESLENLKEFEKLEQKIKNLTLNG
ncbi:HinfI family type II restriction enzyme [Helicobacter cetorum]|uniref:HinfI family type II restriction enzyme n=1 Tax=Helicobacter cetorum TaxID=138563 RepID=UPI000CF0CCCD|nr:restriction endonuclease [Helicobacter cetorum]